MYDVANDNRVQEAGLVASSPGDHPHRSLAVLVSLSRLADSDGQPRRTAGLALKVRTMIVNSGYIRYVMFHSGVISSQIADLRVF